MALRVRDRALGRVDCELDPFCQEEVGELVDRWWLGLVEQGMVECTRDRPREDAGVLVNGENLLQPTVRRVEKISVVLNTKTYSLTLVFYGDAGVRAS